MHKVEQDKECQEYSKWGQFKYEAQVCSHREGGIWAKTWRWQDLAMWVPGGREFQTEGSAHATVLRHLHTCEVCLRESKEANDWSGVNKGGWRGEGGNSIMCKAQRKGHYRIISFSPHNNFMSQAQLHSFCNDNGVQNCKEWLKILLTTNSIHPKDCRA